MLWAALDTISYALLAMVAIKFVDDFRQAKPHSSGSPAKHHEALIRSELSAIYEDVRQSHPDSALYSRTVRRRAASF
jgi:hypothetical protein